MSSTKRNDFWRNELNAPFTSATRSENPGPGKYEIEKKKNDIKAKI